MDRLKNNNDDSRIDYGVILPVFILCLIGMLSLYVALTHDTIRDPNVFRGLAMQAIWYVVGALAVVIIIHFDAKLLWRLTPFLYVIGLAVMLALLKYYDPALAESTGSKNWFKIGTFTFQPSELMKIAYILMMALIITKHNVANKLHTLRTDAFLIIKMMLVTLPVLGLILAQKDFGTMLVFLAIFSGMFLMSGISWLILVPAIALAVVIGGTMIFLVTTDSGRDLLTHIGFKNYQFARIDSWLDPFHDPQGKSYQLARSLMAIGSGGMLGTGYNVSNVYVPVRESDMIFTVIGENFGFVGGAFVILLYFILIYRMIRLCFDMNNEFYAYIASGIVMMMLFHVFENIGANIGLLPLTGIPLPFISQGGSSILGNMIGIGLILSMRYQSANKKPIRRTRSA
ncbi:FtsW/RodA/SpoVE family cell cycle protein [Candidatus Enterococcus murrayae]|uniref:FtsW/RodA/SpoVE family cell cycle protein n=1 Tax=Candidatus Enterococcus murrayae TaxID=2815321 RepID=A0ABS3HI01_9ENTE|nr:FtsW/RodA/SpoVE family cell cycle protein [Enterococcus sp. MJM16]MBO0453084.1 FtsW/RodA/SpoVE family cell cycle protein [Enterococcus sp. MJM16]